MNKSGKIAIIGDKDSILPFKAVGVEIFPVATSYEAGDTLKALAKADYAIIFIVEQFAEKIRDILAKLKASAYPTVIPIPSQAGSTGFGLHGLKADVEKAVGADILFKQ